MRRNVLLLLLLVAALAFVANASPASLFVISGKGWGHGVGLSQYGALGFAREGASYRDILAHYYQGTELGAAPATEVRVLLIERSRTAKVGSEAPYRLTDADGQSFKIEPGTLRLNQKLEIDVGGELRKLTPPVRLEPRKSFLKVSDRAYRGALVVSLVGRRLSVVNHVGLEEYLYGVVPREVPPDWPVEALRAQAVAARSYALADRRDAGDFDLYADTRSQVYGGISAEDERTNAAVDDTAGQVVLYEGAVARTFFFSTSGGRTAASVDVWGEALPYLIAVEDPHDTLSPYHTWGPIVFTGRDLARALAPDAPRALRDLTVTRSGSNRVAAVTLVGAKKAVDVSGTDMRSRLGLRSTWFDVGVLALSPVGGTVPFGRRAVLSGVVRGLADASLERRLPGGSWESLGPVALAGDGSFRQKVGKARETALYRLVTPSVTGVPARVRVATRITLGRAKKAGKLRGQVRPKIAGATVKIQMREGRRWVTVTETTTNRGGKFSAAAGSPGTYRAVARVGRGLVQGVSPEVELGG